jgi:hypothetical protein
VWGQRRRLHDLHTLLLLHIDMTLADIQAQFAITNTALDTIATHINDGTGGLSAADAQAVLDGATAIANKATAIVSSIPA